MMMMTVFSPRASPVDDTYFYFFLFFLSVTEQGRGIWGEHRWYAKVLPVHRNNITQSWRPDLNPWPAGSEADALPLDHTASAVWSSGVMFITRV